MVPSARGGACLLKARAGRGSKRQVPALHAQGGREGGSAIPAGPWAHGGCISVGGRDSGGKRGMPAHGPLRSTATRDTAEERGLRARKP